MIANPLAGAIILSIGGCSSALCYTPQKKTRGWSWQSYWLAQALVCWLVLPWIGAWVTTPHLMTVLAEAPTRVMVNTALLGSALRHRRNSVRRPRFAISVSPSLMPLLSEPRA